MKLRFRLSRTTRRRTAQRKRAAWTAGIESLEDRTLLSFTIDGAAAALDGAPYVLQLSASDPSDPTITGWTINWGDGTVEMVPGNPSDAQHTYNGAGKTHVVSATATNADGTFAALYADGDLVIPGFGSHNALRYDRDTGALVDVFVPAGSGGLHNPVGAAYGPDGNYYVASFATDNVLRYDGKTGAFLDAFVPAGVGGLNGPLDVVFGPDGDLYVSSFFTDNVLRYDGTTGAFDGVFASGPGLDGPRGVVFGPDGNLYVNSVVTASVERFDGGTGASLGTFVASGSGGLGFPEGLLFGPNGDLFVASRTNDSVLRYDGASGAFLSAFVPSGSGGLNDPVDMVFGPDDNFYVTSVFSNEVLRYDGDSGSFIDSFIATAPDGLSRPAYLNYEPLTVAVVPTTFVVTNTNDSGPGSLRQAILDANAAPLAQTIAFNIPTTDPGFVDVDSALPGGDAAADAFVIQPLSALPALSDTTGGTTIDGRTQTAFTGDTNPFGPEIVLDGSLAGSTDGLAIFSDNHSVFGLNVQGFARNGINVLGGNDNWIAGNYIGTDATGHSKMANGLSAVLIRSGAHSNVVGTNGDGVTDAHEGNVLSGNVGNGVYILGAGADNNVVAGNYIGTDATGTAALSNGGKGVDLQSGPRYNRIGTNGDGVGDSDERNVISGNASWGVALRFAGTDQNIVAGNYIGTDATGTVAMGNQRDGILIDGAQNRIGTDGDGSADASERNLISANAIHGIRIRGAGTSNVIAGNYIGTDVTGTVALGNAANGIRLAGTFNRIGTNGDNVSDALEGNVISGNGLGIEIDNVGNVVAGNFIGTDVGGTSALGNARGGILLASSSNLIGTDADGVADDAERNVISGNGTVGLGAADIKLTLAASHDNVIAGNFIGTDATGTLPIGSIGWGVQFANGAHSNLLGTNGDGVNDAAEANTIAFHNLSGVVVSGATTTGNSIRRNSIHDNGRLGIDLGGDGVTANDSDDPDIGPNDLQNFPVLALAEAGPTTHVVGAINSTPSTTFTIDVYANTAADPSGFGEGERYLGSFSVTTDAFGDATIDEVLAAPTVAGEAISATATDPAGNTSEFSQDTLTLETFDSTKVILDELLAEGAVNEGQAESITSMLDNTAAKLDDGNTTAAANQLNATINHVQSLVEEGVLTPAEGQALIDAVNNLLSQISSNGSALLLDGGGDGLVGGAATLTRSALAGVLDQAIAFWSVGGMNGRNRSALADVNVYIADLPATMLGYASPTGNVWIDADAAGFGWSVEGSSPHGVDLLRTVAHELGHVLGFSHSEGSGLMGATLAPGVWLASSRFDSGPGAGDALGFVRSFRASARSLDGGPAPSREGTLFEAFEPTSSANLRGDGSPARTYRVSRFAFLPGPGGDQASSKVGDPDDESLSLDDEDGSGSRLPSLVENVDRLFADFRDSLVDELFRAIP